MRAVKRCTDVYGGQVGHHIALTVVLFSHRQAAAMAQTSTNRWCDSDGHVNTTTSLPRTLESSPLQRSRRWSRAVIGSLKGVICWRRVPITGRRQLLLLPRGLKTLSRVAWPRLVRSTQLQSVTSAEYMHCVTRHMH